MASVAKETLVQRCDALNEVFAISLINRGMQGIKNIRNAPVPRATASAPSQKANAHKQKELRSMAIAAQCRYVHLGMLGILLKKSRRKRKFTAKVRDM